MLCISTRTYENLLNLLPALHFFCYSFLLKSHVLFFTYILLLDYDTKQCLPLLLPTTLQNSQYQKEYHVVAYSHYNHSTVLASANQQGVLIPQPPLLNHSLIGHLPSSPQTTSGAFHLASLDLE
ncbi:hypothetical protein Hamer_G018705 [Homarus americanus]|uniref:Uncharacterized protein n=1 Tax=Homarus americanus TaxID=6706 RepID=A0A8J5TJP2_HOMAM|nr:hypothetical protein Hamer_G018705 [Homarus americanus]